MAPGSVSRRRRARQSGSRRGGSRRTHSRPFRSRRARQRQSRQRQSRQRQSGSQRADPRSGRTVSPSEIQPDEAQQPEAQQPEAQQTEAQQPESPLSDGRPFSPWAERYGPPEPNKDDSAFRRADVIHSTYAPDHPLMHPMFYGNDFSAQGWGVFQSGDQKDRFFVSDNHFLRYFQGNAPWQLGPLQRFVRFSNKEYLPGGHDQNLPGSREAHEATFEEECIKVDEDSWFSFLKKDRWFATSATEPILAQNSWTVDDPVIWKEFRIALELANRILSALIRDRHLFIQTLLYGEFMLWSDATKAFDVNIPEPSPNAKFLMSYPLFRARWEQVGPQVPCPLDWVQNISEEDYRRRLEKILEGQQFALNPLDTPETSARVSGVTYRDINGLIMLNVYYLRPLLRKSVTLAERCWLYFFQAKVILHELTHAIALSRVRSEGPPSNIIPPGADNGEEAYVDFNGSAEMGYYNPDIDFLPLLPYMTTWPFPDIPEVNRGQGSKARGHPAFAAGVENKLTLLPALFPSTLLAESFWQNPAISRKSDNFFHMTTNFCSRSPHNPAYSSAVFYRKPVVIEDKARLIEKYTQGLLDPVLVETIRNWEQRENLWNEARRGWYAFEKIAWDASPWSLLTARISLTTFNLEWEKGPGSRSLYTCAWNADSLTLSFGWTSNREEYIKALSRKPSQWVWLALGLLMNAAIPIRQHKYRRPELVHTINRTIEPSKTMPSQRGKKFVDYAPRAFYPVACSRTVLYDPFGREGQHIPAKRIRHLDFLDQVNYIITLWAESGVMLSTPWLNEIMRVEAKIRAQRTQLYRESDPQSWQSSWAEGAWDFTLPEYDPMARSRWDPQQKLWVSI
ncbi:hypothetical protein GGS21DRAFT_504374 [Xylaria nigripes]|nr:hypothetical protein GGS21DRAFT_504374 [Xylaria nigripes]